MTKILSTDPAEQKKFMIQAEKAAAVLKTNPSYKVKDENKIAFAFDDAVVAIMLTREQINGLTQDVLATTIFNAIVAKARTMRGET